MKYIQSREQFIGEKKSYKLNEGQFSWMTQDTGEQIGSERQNTIDVYMYDNKGNKWKETKYDGYGRFGGMDYYDLVATMNGYDADRQKGIDLAFGKLKTKDKKRKTLFPALVTDPRYNWKRHDFTQEADSDPNQSWYQEEEYDYYEARVHEGKYDKMVDKGDGHIHFILKDEKSAEKLADKIEEEGLGDCDFYPQGKKIYLRVSLTGQEDKVNVNVPKIEKIVGMKAKSGSPETWDGYMLGEDEVFTEGVKGYSAAERMEMGKKGLALPDGSFPIRNLNDLKNAIMAYGRAKDQSAAAKFIAKRAKALNAEDLIPDTEDFQKALKEAEFGRIPKFGE